MSAHHLRTVPTEAERSFLLGALGLGPAFLVAPGALDWPFLLPYARGQMVLPALGWALRPSSPSDLPPGVAEALTDAAVHNEIQNRVLLADLAQAVDLLDRAGIESMAIKGAALLAQIDGLVRTRHTDDVDLWIDPARVHEADHLLRARGYRPLHPDAMEVGPGRVHHLAALVSERGTPFELHAHPRYITRFERGGWAELVGRAVVVQLGGVPVRVRDRPAMLRDLATHVVIAHAACSTLWPRHLLDMAALRDGGRSLVAEAEAPRAALSPVRLALACTARIEAEVSQGAEGLLARSAVFPTAPPAVARWSQRLLKVMALPLNPHQVTRRLRPLAIFSTRHPGARVFP